MLHAPDHVTARLDALQAMPFRRIMLPDTLGLLAPGQVERFIGRLVAQYPKLWFDFHAHNDYGLATANCLAALKAGVRSVHCTINGLGERAGNAPLDEVVVAARDFLDMRCRVNEKRLADVARLTAVFTGKRVAWNKPIVGEDVFTQTAGIHADGDKKGELYVSRLTPDRFGRKRSYALGKLMGKASLEFNLAKLGIKLGPEQKKLLLRASSSWPTPKKSSRRGPAVHHLGRSRRPRRTRLRDQGLHDRQQPGLRPAASILVRCHGREYQATATGDGGYDAFFKALRTLEKDLGFKLPHLVDYAVRIPPGGKTDALVETTITWEGGLKTRGVNSDQLTAAIDATSHAMNIIARRDK